MKFGISVCSIFVLVIFSTAIQAKSLYEQSQDSQDDEIATTERSSRDFNIDEDDYGLGIIFDTSELDYYGRNKDKPELAESKTEPPSNYDENATDDIEKLIVTSKAYLTCGEGENENPDCGVNQEKR